MIVHTDIKIHPMKQKFGRIQKKFCLRCGRLVKTRVFKNDCPVCKDETLLPSKEL